MKSLLAFVILSAVMYGCAKSEPPKPPATPPATALPTASRSLDEEALQSELVKLENDITKGAVNGDITLLAKDTTDDFALTGVDGKTQNKNEALADVKKEKNVQSFSITGAELLSSTNDTAVLGYNLNITVKSGRTGSARVTDTFVKKNGHWLLKKEVQTGIQK